MFKCVFLNENNDMYVSAPFDNEDIQPKPINDGDICVGKVEYDERYSETVTKMDKYECSLQEMQEIVDVVKPETLEDLIVTVAFRYAEGSFSYYKNLFETGIQVNKDHVLSTRDDINSYLMFSGIDEDLCFEITEYVRKGKANFQKTSENWTHYKEVLSKENRLLWFIYMCEQATYIPPREMVLNYLVDYWNKGYFETNRMADNFRSVYKKRTISEKEANDILMERLTKIVNVGFINTFKSAMVYERHVDGNNYYLKVGARSQEGGIHSFLNEGVSLETGKIIKEKKSGVDIAQKVDSGELVTCTWCYKGQIINEYNAGIYYICTNPECKHVIHILKRHMSIDYRR